jgi:hypothetical protein
MSCCRPLGYRSPPEWFDAETFQLAVSWLIVAVYISLSSIKIEGAELGDKGTMGGIREVGLRLHGGCPVLLWFSHPFRAGRGGQEAGRGGANPAWRLDGTRALPIAGSPSQAKVNCKTSA